MGNCLQPGACISYGSLPPKPEPGKWTKTPPSVDWLTISVAIVGNEFFSELVKHSYHHVKVDVSEGTDMSNLDFGQVTGVRVLCAGCWQQVEVSLSMCG